jgi:hypothetical protein
MSTDIPEIVTDIGAPAPKPFGKQRGGRPGIALGDFDALRRAAHALTGGTPRQLMARSIDELQALFTLAALGGDAIQLAVNLAAASDEGASRAVIEHHLNAVLNHARTMMEKPPCSL